MAEKLVVVGAGHGSGQLVASLRQKKYQGEITLIGEEPYFPYQRPPLSKSFLAGEMPAERLYFKPASFYDDPNIELHLGVRIDALDRHSEMGESIDRGFVLAPIVLIDPVRAELLHVVEVRTVLPSAIVRHLVPGKRRDLGADAVERLVGDLDAKGNDR